MCSFNVVAVLHCSWLLSFASAIILDGSCKPATEQSAETTRGKLQNVLNRANETLIPVAITAPEKEHFHVPFSSSTFKTSFRFSVVFGTGQCVGEIEIGINSEQKSEMDFIVNDEGIQSGNAFVQVDRYDRDYLVYICQNVMVGSRDGHVVHFWVLQKKTLLSRSSMRMESLMTAYRQQMEQWGLSKDHLLSLQENEFEFCDPELQNQFNRFGKTLFWFRTVVLILIVIMLLITVAGFAIRFFNAAAKLNKVRNFSAN